MPQTIPLFPLAGAILMPRGVLALNIFEPRYLNMVDDALGGDRLIGMIQPATGDEDAPIPDLADVGTAGRITAFSETDDGRYLVTLTGICRFEFNQELEAGTPYRQAWSTTKTSLTTSSRRAAERIDRDASSVPEDYALLQAFRRWDSVEQDDRKPLTSPRDCPLDAAASRPCWKGCRWKIAAKRLALLEWTA